MTQTPWILGSAILSGILLATLPVTVAFPAAVFLGFGLTILLVYTVPHLHKVFLLLGFIVFLLTFLYGEAYKQSFDSLLPREGVSNTYRVVGLPEEKEFYNEVRLQNSNCQLFWCHEKRVLWQAPIGLRVHPGEGIHLTCDLQIPENFSPDFDYRLYLAKEGIGFLCKDEASFVTLSPDTFGKWQKGFYLPKITLENALSQSLPEPEAGLAKGLLLGGSNYLSGTTKEKFRNVGLTHIVAVSGYNIVIVVNALLALALTAGLWRKSATLLSFFGIIFFILLIGCPASAVRAGIMAGAAFGAFLIGRVNYSLLAIFMTAALMTLWNPLILLYDAGFQLSFLSTLAVVVALRVADNRFSSKALVKIFQEIIWLSVWVYLLLLPLLLLQFKTLTILSIPANILFLPVVPLAMLGSFLVAVSTLLFPPSSVFVGIIAYLPLTYIIKGVYFLGTFKEVVVPLSFSLPVVLLWYGFLFWMLLWWEEKRRKEKYEKNFTCPHHH